MHRKNKHPGDVEGCEIEYQYQLRHNKLRCYQGRRDTLRDLRIQNILHLALLLLFEATLTTN